MDNLFTHSTSHADKLDYNHHRDLILKIYFLSKISHNLLEPVARVTKIL